MPQYSSLGIGYFDVAFAVDGDLTPVPDASQPNGTVSYTTGYGVSYSTAVASGGYNFPRAQNNQILNDITTLLQYQGQGNFPPFITEAMNGGSAPYTYGLGAVCSYTVSSVLGNYVSTAANNTTVPGAMGAHWAPLESSTVPLFVGGTSTGSANTQAVTTNQGNFSNVAGNIVTWEAGYSVTGTSSLNPDSVGAITVKVQTQSGLRNTLTGDIIAGQEYIGISDGTVIQLLNPTPLLQGALATILTTLGFNDTEIGSGYYKLPGGLIVQFFIGTGGTVQPNTFPLTFPNSVLAVTTAAIITAGDTCSVSSVTTSGFNATTAASTFYCIAIGN